MFITGKYLYEIHEPAKYTKLLDRHTRRIEISFYEASQARTAQIQDAWQ
jgi:hypothetical protein